MNEYSPVTATHAIAQRLLQTLVPVNALTVDHLNTLLRDQFIESVCPGQLLFDHNDFDSKHVYLLSGEISLTDDSGLSTILTADNPICRYPLTHFQPRRHSAKTLTDCSLMRFDSDQLDAMLAWDQASRYITLDIAAQRDLDEDADWMLTLLNSNFFYKVPPMNIRSVLSKFEAQYVASGETILRQGELGDCCYFIKEGVAEVFQAQAENHHSELVAELGVGRCFGEDALVGDKPRNATIVMRSNGVLMRLDKQDFFLLLKPPLTQGLSFDQAITTITEPAQWIDVRTQDEFEQGHRAGAINMPLDLLKLKSRMLDQAKRYLIYCNSGRRSSAAAHLLGQDGFDAAVLSDGVANLSRQQQEQFSSGLNS
ncbi:cyclic nucleotide-binding domain-containing protein [Oceanicoccus sp. KOV_DT_Chl]|uniref:cyclic nucleotide-binding domain-containing protein n=1 Tax=Oceanicoccus sp. KOV_DT_Chl TaxID=1904639 RepID=UPI000C7CB78D|nr:cyclic nucleotide-binding domain-containing protein [Oceanicoccus sp. KOV_DT_Chl]